MPVDFDALFAQWVRGKIDPAAALDKDEIEQLAAELYETWLWEPRPELGHMPPAEAFAGQGPEQLMAHMRAYAKAHMRLPDPLADAIATQEGVEALCLEELSEGDADTAMPVIGFLEERQSVEAMPLLMELLLEKRDMGDAVAERACEALMSFGEKAAKMALASWEQAESQRVLDRLCDIACSAGKLPGAFERLQGLFWDNPDNMHFYAQCFARLGDDRAKPLLLRALQMPDIDYFTYTALRDAVEELGEWVEIEREFSGDRDYELLREIEQTGEDE